MFVLVMFSACASVIRYLPKATLAAILFNAAIGLIEVHEIGFMLRLKSLQEILLFLATWGMCFFVSIGQGILLCLLFASFLIIRRSTFLHAVLLGGNCH
jgi:MFS superfamily sulfate permease-like transporter